MSTDGYKIRKCKVTLDGRRTEYEDICATSGVTLFNVLKDISPKEAKVNYS